MKKIKYLLTIAVVAMVTLTSPALHAALTYASGDLYLGFRQVGNNTSDFAVNIGAAGNYKNANDPLAPITLTLSNLTTLLNGLFGNTWATDSTVRWGIIGTTNTLASADDTVKVIYATKGHGGTAPINASNQDSPSSNVNNLVSYYSNGANGGSASNLTESTVSNGSVGVPGNTNSFTGRVTTNFGSVNIGTIDAPFTDAGGLDLFRIPRTSNGSVTLEGTFTLNAVTDVLTFTPVTAAIPEPSSIALSVIALGGFGIMLRKRKQVSA